MKRLSKILIAGSCLLLLVASLAACGGGAGQSGRSWQSDPGPGVPASGDRAPVKPPPADQARLVEKKAVPHRGPSESERLAPDRPAARKPRPEERRTAPSGLTAGEVDDNERFDEYLRFRQEYRGPHVNDVDVSERYKIRVLDKNNRPISDAMVWVSTEYDTVFEGRTYADGRTQFFPKAFSRTGSVRVFRLYVEKDGVSQYLDVDRYEGDEWVIKLDMSESHRRRVPLDVLFLVDSTSSMADEIERIKSTLLSISERIDKLPSRPDLRFGMVTYRDRGDSYVTRTFDFQRDVRGFLKTIEKVRADGGGDYPESVNEALHVALH